MPLRTDRRPFNQNQIDHYKKNKNKRTHATPRRAEREAACGSAGLRRARASHRGRSHAREPGLATALTLTALALGGSGPRRRAVPAAHTTTGRCGPSCSPPFTGAGFPRSARGGPGSRSAPRGREPLRAPPRGLPVGLQRAQSWSASAVSPGPRVCAHLQPAPRGAQGGLGVLAQPRTRTAAQSPHRARLPRPRPAASPWRWERTVRGQSRVQGRAAGEPASLHPRAPPEGVRSRPGPFRDAGIQRPEKVKGAAGAGGGRRAYCHYRRVRGEKRRRPGRGWGPRAGRRHTGDGPHPRARSSRPGAAGVDADSTHRPETGHANELER